MDNAIKLVSDIFMEVSKKLSQQDIKVCQSLISGLQLLTKTLA